MLVADWFMALSAARQFGWSMAQPFVLSEIVAAGRLAGIDGPEEMRWWVRLIQSADAEALSVIHARSQHASDGQHARAPPR